MSGDRGDRIEAVDAAVVRAPVPEVIRFGAWVMEHREFALVRVRTGDGICGYAFTLSRDGPVAEMVHNYIGPRYLQRPTREPAEAFGEAVMCFGDVYELATVDGQDVYLLTSLE